MIRNLLSHIYQAYLGTTDAAHGADRVCDDMADLVSSLPAGTSANVVQ